MLVPIGRVVGGDEFVHRDLGDGLGHHVGGHVGQLFEADAGGAHVELFAGGPPALLKALHPLVLDVKAKHVQGHGAFGRGQPRERQRFGRGAVVALGVTRVRRKVADAAVLQALRVTRRQVLQDDLADGPQGFRPLRRQTRQIVFHCAGGRVGHARNRRQARARGQAESRSEL